MPNKLKPKVWLIGAGGMAVDYVKVLTALNISFEIIGRGEDSAKKMFEATGKTVITGGLELALKNNTVPDHAIVATGVEQLANTTASLLNAGIKKVLLEKPGGFYEAIEGIARLADKQKADVLLAYNRRYYAGVAKAEEIIKEDGGVTSFNFEFTEWSHTIEPLQKAEGVKEQWLLGNSSHVIDLAFYLGGYPEKMASYVTGSLNWHPSASIFSGAGISEKGALFSYHANWEAPGRWVVEVLTKRHRMIFKPMEKLQIQKIGSVAVEDVVVDYTIDTEFKPGLYLQVKEFLEQDTTKLPNIKRQLENIKLYRQINFGSNASTN